MTSPRHGRRLLPALALVAPVVLTLAAPPVAGVPGGRPPASPRTASPAADGRFLYQRDCAVCHGPDGEGTPRAQSLRGVSPAEVDYALSTGRMPISEPGVERRRRPAKYSRAERAAIVEFMRPFLAAHPDIPHVDVAAGDLGLGGELYSALCAACHQSAGQGGALLGGIESPALDKSTPLQVAEAVLAGPVNMPPFVLSEHEVNSIARYVQYLQNPDDRGGAGVWHFGPFSEGAVAWVLGLGALVVICLWIGTRE